LVGKITVKEAPTQKASEVYKTNGFKIASPYTSNKITMKTIKYFILLLMISASFSSCFVRHGDHGHDGEVHHDGDRH